MSNCLVVIFISKDNKFKKNADLNAYLYNVLTTHIRLFFGKNKKIISDRIYLVNLQIYNV